MEEKQDNDLVVPLTFHNQFAHFIFRNKPMNKIAYNPVIVCFLLGGLVLLIIAIYTFVAIGTVTQIEVNYYSPNASNCLPNSVCTVSFTLSKTLKAPIYLLYRLDDFYQNHRRYIQSKSNDQLLGKILSQSDVSICSPYITNSDMKVTKSWGGFPLDPNAVANPCGAIAFTFYNDTFSLSNNGNSITIDETGITWPNDVYGKYRRAQNSNQIQWIDPQNQHFINWMRISGLPNFRKIWGIIHQDLIAGQYTMAINNNYNITLWKGNKYFILTTDSSAGGNNYLLPVVLLLAGIMSFVAAFYLRIISKEYKKAIYL